MPFPSPGALPDPVIKHGSPTFQADSLSSELPGKSTYMISPVLNVSYVLVYLILIIIIYSQTTDEETEAQV